MQIYILFNRLIQKQKILSRKSVQIKMFKEGEEMEEGIEVEVEDIFSNISKGNR